MLRYLDIKFFNIIFNKVEISSSYPYRFPINLYFVNIQTNQTNIIIMFNAIKSSKKIIAFLIIHCHIDFQLIIQLDQVNIIKK